MSQIRIGDLLPLVETAATRAGLDPSVARAIVLAENSGDKDTEAQVLNKQVGLNTLSPKGAAGLFQIMPGTLSGLIQQGFVPAGVKMHTVEGQIAAFVGALKEKTKYAGNDPARLAVTYNGGLEALSKFNSDNGDVARLSEETRGYLGKVGKYTKLTYSNSTYNQGALDNMLGTANNYVAQGSQLMGQLKKENQSFSDLSKEAVRTVDEVGAAKAASIRAKNASDVESVDSRRKLLQQFGIDAQNADSKLMEHIDAATAAEDTALFLQKQMGDLRSVSITDNPIQWLTNQVQLQGVSHKYNAAAAQYNSRLAAIENRQIAAQRQANLQPGVSRDKLLAQGAADADLAEKEAKLAKVEIEGKRRQAVISGISTELSFLNMQFNQAHDMARMLQQRMSLVESDKQNDKDALDVILINAKRGMMGLDPVTVDQYKKVDAGTRTKWLEDATRKTLNIADTPGKSMLQLWDYQAMTNFKQTLSPAAAKFVDDLHLNGARQAKALTQANPKLKADEAYSQAIDGKVAMWKKEMEDRDYSRLSPDHPLRMNASVYASADALNGNPIAEYFRAMPQGGAGMSEKEVLMFGVSAIRKGTPPEQVARDLSSFFHHGMKQQIQEYRLNLLGFDVKNPKSGQIEYPYDGDVFGFVDQMMDPRLANSPKKNLQLMDPGSLQHWLQLNAIKAQANNLPTIRELMTAGAANPISANPGVNMLGAIARRTDIDARSKEDPAYDPRSGPPSPYASPQDWKKYREFQKGEKK